MSVTPPEVLASAKLLRTQQADEAGYRATVSRAYYGAFHAASDFHVHLPSPGSVGSATGRHEQLVSQLRSPTLAKTDPQFLRSRRMGMLLGDMHRLRVIADYKLSEKFTEGDADSALRMADSLFALS